MMQVKATAHRYGPEPPSGLLSKALKAIRADQNPLKHRRRSGPASNAGSSWRGNPRLKVGDVKEKDADTITADIVTKDNSLVQRFIINRHTGAYTRDNS